MNKKLKEIIESYPTKVNWSDIVDFDNFDERLSAIDCIVVNTIGVSKGFIEFIPDNNPPLFEEILCWIWTIRPDLNKEILKLDNLNMDLKVLLEAYFESNMEKFWDYMS